MAKAQKSVVRQGDDANLSSNGLTGNRVHFVVAKTINIGNYESIRVEYGESRAVEEGQSFQGARAQLVVEVLAQLHDLADSVTQAMTS